MNTVLLFETPWWLPTAIIFVGTVLFYTATKRREMKLRTAGLAVAALGILVAGVGFFGGTEPGGGGQETREAGAPRRKKKLDEEGQTLDPPAHGRDPKDP